MEQEHIDEAGVSRRDLLRRGAVLGGALAWATPVVQVIGMSPALATAVSPPPPNGECVNKWATKYNLDENNWEANNTEPCGGCAGHNLTDNGPAYLTISGDEDSFKVCAKAGVTILSGVVKAGQDCVTVSPASDGCLYFTKGQTSQSGLSNILVCFCVDEVE